MNTIRNFWLQYTDRTPLFLLSVPFALFTAAAIALGRWAVGIAIVCSLFLLIAPLETALGVYAFAVPFDMSPISALSGKTVTWALGIVAAVIAFVAGAAMNRLESLPKSAAWWSLFITWSAISALWAANPSAVLTRLPTAFSLFLFFLVCSSLRVTPGELYRISLFALAGGVVAAMWASTQASQGMYYEGQSMRASLLLGTSGTDPNVFAASLLLPVSLSVGGFLTFRSLLAKFAMLAAIVALGHAIFLSMSRGALAALSVMALVYLIRLRLNYRIFIPVCCVLALLPVIPDLFFARIMQAQKGGDIRTWIWTTGLRKWVDQPIQGLGLDNFPVATGSHSFLVGITVELGVVGLFLFIGAVSLHLWAAKRTSRVFGGTGFPMVAYEAACWSLLVAAIFLDIVWRKYFWLTWMLVELAVKVNRHAADDMLVETA